MGCLVIDLDATFAETCMKGEPVGHYAGHQEVGRYHTRGECQAMYMYATTKVMKVQIRLLTLALKPRGDVIRSPTQGYQWPYRRTCVH